MPHTQDVMAFDYSRVKWLPRVDAKLVWKNGDRPLDYHVCGFHNDLCPQLSTSRFNAEVIGSIMAIATALAVIILWSEM